MKKDLPGLYKGQVDKQINKKVYYSWEKDNAIRKNNNTNTIGNLFASGSYIFNKNILITTKSNQYRTKIAGKMGNKIITFDNNVIPVNEIVDIQILDK